MSEQPLPQNGCRPKSWRILLDSGFEPRDYPWEGLPIGTRRVTLDESLWHRHETAVICFFHDLDSDQRYRLTVFRDPETHEYGPKSFDVSHLCPGTILTIEIHQNRTGTFRLQAAQLAAQLA
jgi:hypothetical protein